MTSDREREREMIQRSRRRTVPQIFIDGESLGGYDDLANLNATGELDQRLGLESSVKVSRIHDVIAVDAGSGTNAALGAF